MSFKKTFLATGLIAAVGGLATAGVISSCDTVCTDEERASVIVHLVDSAGNPVTGEALLYKVEEIKTEKAVDWRTDVQNGECVDSTCTQWQAGVEQEGHFSLSAQVCGNHYLAQVDVGLEDTGCHVDTQHVFITVPSECPAEPTNLVPKPADPGNFPLISGELAKPHCTGPFRPSVILEVTDAASEVAKPVHVDDVWWEIEEIWPATRGICMPAYLNEDGTWSEIPGPSSAPEPICSEWVIGVEQAGEFDITATVCNKRYTKKVAVHFEDDGCHVFTERVQLPVDISECPQ